MHTSEARTILGDDLLCLDEVAAALGTPAAAFDAATLAAAETVPLSRDELEAARRQGEALIFRTNTDGREPLTIHHFIERFPAAFRRKGLTTVGYMLRDEWGIAIEPLVRTEVCAAGWALARKSVLPETRNLPYYDQDSALQAYSRGRLPGREFRRRSATEAVYDLVLYHACRGARLLVDTFDWTSSRTVDNSFLNVGGFYESGMALFGFSAPVRHNDLGVCPACVLR